MVFQIYIAYKVKEEKTDWLSAVKILDVLYVLQISVRYAMDDVLYVLYCKLMYPHNMRLEEWKKLDSGDGAWAALQSLTPQSSVWTLGVSSYLTPQLSSSNVSQIIINTREIWWKYVGLIRKRTEKVKTIRTKVQIFEENMGSSAKCILKTWKCLSRKMTGGSDKFLSSYSVIPGNEFSCCKRGQTRVFLWVLNILSSPGPPTHLMIIKNLQILFLFTPIYKFLMIVRSSLHCKSF